MTVRASPRARRLVTGASLALIAIGVVLDLYTPARISLEATFAAAPMVAAPFLSGRGTALIGALSTVIHSVMLFAVGHAVLAQDIVRGVNVMMIALLAVAINYVIRRTSVVLASTRSVAEAAQHAIMPPPPSRVGDLDIGARYQAAQLEAQIGGDMYAVQETPFGVRLLVGDVRGKGLGAVELLAVAIGAFREGAMHRPSLAEVAQRMEEALQRQTRMMSEETAAENFLTAVLGELPTDGRDVLRMINRAHPAPLILYESGSVRSLPPSSYQLPLGLGDVVESRQTQMDEVPWPDKATLVLYTDGVSEARDADGEFFDPEQWLRGRSFSDPQQLLDDLVASVKEHAGGDVADDMAMLAVTRRKETG